LLLFFFFQAEDGIRDLVRSRGLGDVYKRQLLAEVAALVDAGVLRTTLGQDLGMINAENLRRAHEILESGASRGKLVLSGFGG